MKKDTIEASIIGKHIGKAVHILSAAAVQIL